MIKGLIKVVDLAIVLLNNFLSSYHFWWLTFVLKYYLMDCKFNYLTYFVSLILDFECILDNWISNEVTNFKKFIHFSWFVINNLVFGNMRSIYEQLNCFLFVVIYYINYWRKFLSDTSGVLVTRRASTQVIRVRSRTCLFTFVLFYFETIVPLVDFIFNWTFNLLDNPCICSFN